MYIPPHFEVKDFVRQVEIIKKYPLGILFTSTGSARSGLLGFLKDDVTSQPDSDMCASHIPFFFMESPEDGRHKLIAHLAIKNQQVEHLEKISKVLVVFQSYDSYISPSWYPLKKKTHKFVPTWNYAAVHVYGIPKIVRADKKWLLNQLNKMTDQEEYKRPEGQGIEEKWKVSDAPEAFVDAKMSGIVGLEIEITDVQSKFKLDQNAVSVNIEGVIKNLEHEVGGKEGEELAKMTKDSYSEKL